MRAMALGGPAQKFESVQRWLDPRHRGGLAKDDAIEGRGKRSRVIPLTAAIPSLRKYVRRCEGAPRTTSKQRPYRPVTK
jgi:hypothetical protein